MKQHDIYRVWEPLNKEMHYMTMALYEVEKSNIAGPVHKLFALPPAHQVLHWDRTIMNLDALVIMRGITATYYKGKPIKMKPQLDIKGKQIFEGDIVLTDEAGWIAQVMWTGDCFMCLNQGWSMMCNWSKFKVLGNIYENPKLIKEHKIICG
jgi:hypothetical protein